jgi:hypothetical protein
MERSVPIGLVVVPVPSDGSHSLDKARHAGAEEEGDGERRRQNGLDDHAAGARIDVEQDHGFNSIVDGCRTIFRSRPTGDGTLFAELED